MGSSDRRVSRSVALAMILLATLAVADNAEPTIFVQGATVVGFFPPYSQEKLDHDDGSIREGSAHVEFALEDLGKCLAQLKPLVRFELTKALKLKDGALVREVVIPDEPGKTVGIVLIKPGADPMIIYATGGPSSLQWTALEAAADYFGSPVCKRRYSDA